MINLRATSLPILVIGICLLTLLPLTVKATDRQSIDSLRIELEELSKKVPALDQKVNISVTDVTVEEFIRAIANSSGLNINVDPSLNILVVNNFSDVRVMDVLLFLYQQYDIEIAVIGNIISIDKPEEKPDLITAETIGVHFDSISGNYSLDYREEDLKRVAKEITKFTDKNVILAPGLESKIVSGYIKNKPFDGALEKFAFTNNLVMRHTEDKFYVLEPKPVEVKAPTQPDPKSVKGKTPTKDEYILEVKSFTNGRINVNAVGAPVAEIIKLASVETGNSFFLSAAIEAVASLNILGATYLELLENLLKGTPYIYQNVGGIFLIGEETALELKDYRIVQFQNRTIDLLSEFIPTDLTEGTLVKEFPELNSFLITGSTVKVDKLEGFLRQLDKVVPLIMIEVIIIDFKKSYIISTGIEAGIGDQPIETRGKVFPEVDVQLSSKTINDIIGSFNGYGWTNLGNVNENFYITLKAMEDQGILKVRSTPKLSTLNGHEAKMNIGEEEYYLEEKTNIIGTQNPQVETVKIYQPISAELSITIRPVVSGDEQITLEIVVQQSDFTERISKTAPPGKVSRKFESLIRVKNQEMVLLGGLEEKSRKESSSGVPLLSRIPILKWIFSSRSRDSSTSKLSIFIRPTIIA